MQALHEQQAREAREQDQAALDIDANADHAITEAEARKHELIQSPFPNGVDALKSKAETLTVLNQNIAGTLMKCLLSAAEEQAERTLAKGRRTQVTSMWDLQRKNPPLIGGTTQSKLVDWFLILENEFVSREVEDSDRCRDTIVVE
jgi:hypothetical protein